MAKLDKDVLQMIESEEKQTKGENKVLKTEINTAKEANQVDISNKSRLVAFLLCYIFGMFGAHRFYVGKNVTAIFYILTFGLFGIGLLVDTLMIILGKFKDCDDNLVTNWIEQ